MDTLDNTKWDVIISGTGLKQSLLALSLSRSSKRILHIDQHAYYGGPEAALSLSEAEAWVQQHADASSKTFSHAVLAKSEDVGSSRSYSLALAPHLIFARSNILSALVSSGSHSQLEFQAVGSWFVLDPATTNNEPKSERTSRLQLVPGSREEVFQDTRLDLRTKRALMKFIRQSSVGTAHEETHDIPLPAYLETQGIPGTAHASILALGLSTEAPGQTGTSATVSNISRHLQSIGHLGPGFAAVTPKYGGLAEIAQASCRACAVGGGVYVLNRAVNGGLEAALNVAASEDGPLNLKLGDDHVTTRWYVCGTEELRPSVPDTVWSRGIYVVNSSLPELFPVRAEGSVTPAGAVIMVPKPDEPPVYLLVHSSETGECPSGKCVVYANVKLPAEKGLERLQRAIQALAEPCWSLQFQHNAHQPSNQQSGHVIAFGNAGFELALDDNVLAEVKRVWQEITQDNVDNFMKFEPRDDGDNEYNES